MKIIYTVHAQDRAIYYSITKKEVKRAITQGSRYKQTDGYLAVYRDICVAYKIVGKSYKIKTVFLG